MPAPSRWLGLLALAALLGTAAPPPALAIEEASGAATPAEAPDATVDDAAVPSVAAGATSATGDEALPDEPDALDAGDASAQPDDGLGDAQATDDETLPSVEPDALGASDGAAPYDAGAFDARADGPADDESWLDSLNRGSREFNFWMFDHVLEPVSRGYNYVVPKWGQQRIQNFFENLERPRDIVNSLLQGKGRRAGNHMAAFLVNTTAGLAGFFVLSDRFIDIEPPETTNETLGVYGIPPGPYLVVPLYGETCPRCALGSVGDAVLYPLFWIPGQAGMYAGIGARGLNAVNLVAKQMPSAYSGSESEWQAYRERLHDRHGYAEAKRLFYENQELDVAD